MTVGLIGAPSSAAGHWPGMEKAPAFLRLAGLPESLREQGTAVIDHGDLPSCADVPPSTVNEPRTSLWSATMSSRSSAAPEW